MSTKCPQAMLEAFECKQLAVNDDIKSNNDNNHHQKDFRKKTFCRKDSHGDAKEK